MYESTKSGNGDFLRKQVALQVCGRAGTYWGADNVHGEDMSKRTVVKGPEQVNLYWSTKDSNGEILRQMFNFENW